MGIKARIEYLKEIYLRYKNSLKKEKTLILNEFTKVCQYNRKYAIRRIKEFPKEIRKKSGPKQIYTGEIVYHLKKLWLAMDQICSKKMKAAIPVWLPFYKEEISPEIKNKLLTISPSTIDRLLKPIRSNYIRAKNSGTRPGNWIKNKIPIQTVNWNITKPGFLEADTVAHCGDSLTGSHAWSITYTDIVSVWTENRATWGRGAEGVLEQTQDVIQSVPFDVWGFDSDNGGEFINNHLIPYLQSKKIKISRSRPYRTQDNANVEQKNWTHVRQLLGYDRFDKPELIPLLNDLYKTTWNPYQNFFIPTIKLVTKQRIGATIKKHFSKPETPYLRLMNSPDISTEQKNKLEQTYKTLNPFKLKEQIESKLKLIFMLLKSSNIYKKAA